MVLVLPDIQTKEVSPGEYVVTAKHHSHIGHKDILQESKTESAHTSAVTNLVTLQRTGPLTYLNTAHDGGGECGVVLRAQHDGVHQNEAARHREGELHKRSHAGL